MRALDRKLLRNLWTLRGQVATIALVIGIGIASYLCLVTAWRSLQSACDDYYAQRRFAEAFARLERAPLDVARRLEAIPGVAVVHVRIVEEVMLPLAGMAEPAVGRVVSWQSGREPPLNDLHLRTGRFAERGRADEAVVLESFAVAHRLALGDELPVVINGVLRKVRVVGTAMSPEYVFSVSYGQFTQDDRRFAVLWMDEEAVEAAFQMHGAFNDVSVRLQPRSSEPDVLDRIDAVLRPWGGTGSYARARHPSHFVVDNELGQLERQSTLPLLFLAVGAFLLSVVLSRLVQLQRGEIAVLKAIGYRDRDIGLHVLELAGAIVTLGALVGVALGAWLSSGLLSLYARVFRFPHLEVVVDAGVVARALLVSAAAGVAGALGSVLRVVRLPPAEAMRPEAPPTYRPTVLERLGIGRLLEPVGRMVFRELVRRPWRTALNVLGVALAVAVAMMGRASYDMVDALVAVQFETAQREDLAVAFRRPVSDRAVREIAALPGVLRAEPMRTVPVRMRAEHHSRDVPLVAYESDVSLRRIVQWPLRTVPLPHDGVLLTDVLARILNVRAGDRVDLEVLEGSRQIRSAVVAGVTADLFGLNAYTTLPALHSLLGEAEGVSAALVSVDPALDHELEARLKSLPLVARVERRRTAIERFHTQTGQTLWISSTILTVFGAIVALGVVYNAARVALSVRGRDLATLRVLGFTRGEIAFVLMAELVVYLALAVLPGVGIGVWFMHVAMGNDMAEVFRMPIAFSGLTYAFAIAVTAVAAAGSGLLLRRRLQRLDLLGVLKARE